MTALARRHGKLSSSPSRVEISKNLPAVCQNYLFPHHPTISILRAGEGKLPD